MSFVVKLTYSPRIDSDGNECLVSLTEFMYLFRCRMMRRWWFLDS